MTTAHLEMQRVIEEIEHEIKQQPQLTDKQLADIREMYERIRSACELGDYDEARRAKALCLSVVAQGPPASE